MKKSPLFACIVLFLLITNMLVAGGKKEATAAMPEETSKPMKVTWFHYWSGALSKSIDTLVQKFNSENPQYILTHTPIESEAFKTSIRVMLAGGNPPDLFAYWAGARTQFIVDADRLSPIDDVFKDNDLDSVFPSVVLQGCTYNGSKYFLPIGQHVVLFFYNKSVFEKAGIESVPTNWNEFLDVCEAIKAVGINPISLGSKNRWPAQSYFDYILLRTAGPEYRARLMAGEASYTDPQIVKTMELWKELIDRGYFNENTNAYDIFGSARMLANGEAGISLMGTWISQLDKPMGWTIGEDYDFFPFPVIDPTIADVACGPIDGVVLPKDAANPEAAKAVMAALASVTSQTALNAGTGGIAPNKNVSESVYNDLQLRVRDLLNTLPNWAFNYDLATPPPVADIGMNSFAKFLDSPDAYLEILKETELEAKKAFSELD
jgi:multiple sugar transport system substrate-binding protein/raffinose/stachyose/melibiose transport system substrate-binding protein